MDRLVLDPDSGDVKMFTKLSKTQNILNASAISSIIVMIFFFSSPLSLATSDLLFAATFRKFSPVFVL